VTRSWPDQEGWARGVVERIGGVDDGHDQLLPQAIIRDRDTFFNQAPQIQGMRPRELERK
jgi:hypothetical protein